MRLWTVHPRHLDARGLVALWREGLLARAVLLNRTRGYRNHPQLDRFKAAPDPVGSINAYLAGVLAEAVRRGYRFDRRKIRGRRATTPIAETRGQLRYEWEHLLRKLRLRDPAAFDAACAVARPAVHPSFRLIAGRVRDWERQDAPGGPPGKSGASRRRTKAGPRRGPEIQPGRRAAGRS